MRDPVRCSWPSIPFRIRRSRRVCTGGDVGVFSGRHPHKLVPASPFHRRSGCSHSCANCIPLRERYPRVCLRIPGHAHGPICCAPPQQDFTEMTQPPNHVAIGAPAGRRGWAFRPLPMTPAQNRVSFATMAVLIFIALNLLLSGGFSTGPHVYVHLGLTDWLELHRYQGSWSVENIGVLRLLLEICLAVLLTWILSAILGRVRPGSRKVGPVRWIIYIAGAVLIASALLRACSESARA